MALIRSIATVGGYTMASRVLGFIRDVLIAHALGAGFAAEAFFVSQRYPNLFRSLFAEGAFNAAFVPQYARRLEGEGQTAAQGFAEQVMAVMATVLLVFTFVAQAGMPWLMYLIAGGFAGTPGKFALSVLLTQITFPYLLFMSLTALQGGILNSLHQYISAAAAADAGRATAVPPHAARHHRLGGHATQSADRHADRLMAGGRDRLALL